MSEPEAWRIKQYYDKRVLIETDRVLNSTFADSLICVTGAQQEMLRNLMQHLHRKSTFVDELADNYYVAPTNEEWDALQMIVAELEEALMGCQEFTDLLTQVLACVCQTATSAEKEGYIGPGTQPAINKYLGDGGLQIEDTYGDDTASDPERCAIAQLTYWAAYDFLTEVTVPLSDTLVDIALPTAMLALAAMVGTTLLGIPTATLIAVLGGLLYLYAQAAEENVINEYQAYKEELICALYRGLATDYRTAESMAVQIIAKMAIGPTDKVLLHAMLAPWAIALAKKAYDNSTAWALAHIEAGYCNNCNLVEGSDWFAIFVTPPNGDVFLDHSTPGAYWIDASVCGPMLDGKTICGLVFEPIEGTGCDIKTTPDGPECAGDNLTYNSSTVLALEQEYYWYEIFTHDEDEAIAALCPDAEKYDELIQQTGPGTWEVAFNIGWNCTGTRKVRVKWIVYEGSPS